MAVAIADLRQKVIEIKADSEEQGHANLKALQQTVETICKNLLQAPHINYQDQQEDA